MKLKRKEKKGDNGKVLVVGGSRDYVGAPAFAALAALRTGVDIVTVCAPEKVAWTINSYTPDIITRKLLGEELNLSHCKEIVALSQGYDVVVIGNGLGINKEFVLRLLREIKKPFIIDADAIKVIALDAVNDSIITPHAKEFEILYTNTVKKPEFAAENIELNIPAIQKYQGTNVILLKGIADIVFTRDKKHYNRTGNSSMTIGGTGDILAGACAGFLAQSGDLFESAKYSAYVNGKLGEYMFKQRGYGYTAYDMVQEMWRFTK